MQKRGIEKPGQQEGESRDWKTQTSFPASKGKERVNAGRESNRQSTGERGGCGGEEKKVVQDSNLPGKKKGKREKDGRSTDANCH